MSVVNLVGAESEDREKDSFLVRVDVSADLYGVFLYEREEDKKISTSIGTIFEDEFAFGARASFAADSLWADTVIDYNDRLIPTWAQSYGISKKNRVDHLGKYKDSVNIRVFLSEGRIEIL